MINLIPGDRGSLNANRLSNESTWLLDTKSDNESDSNTEYYPSNGTDEAEESDKTVEEVENGISDLDGNRILPIGKIVNTITNHVCCTRCTKADRKFY